MTHYSNGLYKRLYKSLLKDEEIGNNAIDL